jgi:hypothetical protein
MHFKTLSKSFRPNMPLFKSIRYFFIVIILIGFISCHDNKPAGVQDLGKQYPDGPGSIILHGNKMPDDVFYDKLMQTSRLNLGGYAVIVPINMEAYQNFTQRLYSGLQERGLMAIYVLDPVRKAMKVRSEMVKIEGARLVVFVGQFIEKLTNLPADNPLTGAIQNAYSTGATVAFVGPTSALAGEIILRKKPDTSGNYPQGQMENYRFVTGLNLLPGTIIDATFSGAVYADFGELRKLIRSRKMAYIGLLKPGKAMIRNGNVVNIGSHDLVWLPRKKGAKNNNWKMILPNGKSQIN